MTDADGERSDMHRPHPPQPRLALDEHTAEGLVAGRVGADDAPPAYARVAQLIEAASGPAQAHELEDEQAVLAMFAREHEDRSPVVDLTSTRRRRARVRPAKVAAVALVGTLALTGGVAAAATGHLPDPAQSAIHEVLAHVGIAVPDAPETTETPRDPGPGQDPGVAPIATDPDTTGQDRGRAVCEEASDDTCQAGEHGRAGEQGPPVTATPATPGPAWPAWR